MFGKKKETKNENASVTPMNMSTTPSVNTTPEVAPAAPAAPVPEAAPVAATPVATPEAQPAPEQAQAVQTAEVAAQPASEQAPAAPATETAPVQTVAVPPEVTPAPAQGVAVPPEVNQAPQGERATPFGMSQGDRATAYGNSANSQGNYGTAVTTLGSINTNVDYSYSSGNENSSKEGLTPKKVAGAIIIILFIVWAFFLYSDYDSAKNGKKPKYCFFGETKEEHDIGTITINSGLGYKVVRYETEDTNLLEFSALWQKNKKLEDISKQ